MTTDFWHLLAIRVLLEWRSEDLSWRIHLASRLLSKVRKAVAGGVVCYCVQVQKFALLTRSECHEGQLK